MHFILVMEDDPIARRLLESVLSTAGYEVEAPKSYMEALGIIGSKTTDVLLLDVSAPEHYGASFVRLARRMGWKGQAVLLSTRADWQTLCGEIQAAFGLGKPFDIDDLIGRITALLPPTTPTSRKPRSARPTSADRLRRRRRGSPARA
jgi:DNA-binding response OmpR family regulator